MFRAFARAIVVVLGFLAAVQVPNTAVAASDLDAAVAKLTEKSFSVKEAAIAEIVASGDPRAVDLLSAYLEGGLFRNKKTGAIVTVEKTEGGYLTTDALTGSALEKVKKRGVKKIRINNKLRGIVKTALGALQLFSDSTETRLKAARTILANPSPAMVGLLEKALAQEDDADIRESLTHSLAALKVIGDDPAARIAAVSTLSGSMDPSIWQVLGRAADQKDDPALAAAAQQALESIENQKAIYSLIETIFFGLSLGAVLMLAAVGLAITFGVMGVINMAHGEMLMLGAYTTFVVQSLMPNAIEYSLFVAIPAAFIVTGLVGIAIERSIIRLLYGRPLETLLATFGVSLFLQQAVRTIFSPLNQPVTTPDWMSGFYAVNGALSLTYNRLYIIAFCILVFVALLLVLKRTPLGLQMRAVTQNRAMASSMGIRTGRVDALTFGLGSGIAGVGGVALSQLTNVGPNLGQAYIVDSFMVVVFGGVGNLWGTLVGAMTLGVANKFMEPFTGAVVAKILVLVFIILFIQRRPRGLFALKGRAVES